MESIRMQFMLYNSFTNTIRGKTIEFVCNLMQYFLIGGYHSRSHVLYRLHFFILLMCVQASYIAGIFLLLLPEKNAGNCYLRYKILHLFQKITSRSNCVKSYPCTIAATITFYQLQWRRSWHSGYHNRK